MASGHVTMDEIIRLDDNTRGTAARARAAIWLDEWEGGVTLRVVDMATGRIVLADTIDPMMVEVAKSEHNFTLSRELERRRRGDSITQTFMDATLYPGQHWSFDWTEQWGDTNANLSGVTLSLFDPFFGIGGCYYRVIPEAFDMSLGAKVIMSVPTALVSAITSESTTLIDPIISAVLVVRVPLFSSNYGIVASLSTNGRVGLGISLLNISLLPFLP
jgi:hypothetical protein